MTIVNAMTALTQWVQTDICNGFRLKVPPADDVSPIDGSYNYTQAAPTAFSCFIPAGDRLPEGVTSVQPCACVQFISGSDTLTQRQTDWRISFVTWDPGRHAQDLWTPNGSGGFTRNRTGTFSANESGWIDCWNLIDKAIRTLEETPFIGDLRVDTSSVRFGQFDTDGNPENIYPFWAGWITFSTIDETSQRSRNRVFDI